MSSVQRQITRCLVTHISQTIYMRWREKKLTGRLLLLFFGFFSILETNSYAEQKIIIIFFYVKWGFNFLRSWIKSSTNNKLRCRTQKTNTKPTPEKTERKRERERERKGGEIYFLFSVLTLLKLAQVLRFKECKYFCYFFLFVGGNQNKNAEAKINKVWETRSESL